MRLYLADISQIKLDMVSQISAERAQKTARYRMTDDKKRCIAGGLFINRFFPNAKISANEYGKPVADNGQHFNLSHSGRYVLFALSEYETGCDIQNTEFVKAEKMAKVVFCENELAKLKNSADKLGTFYDMWTKKESLLKCIGSGFHRNSKSVDVSGDTFEENGKKYYFKLWHFSDCTICVCSEKNNFAKNIEFINLGDAKNE